jgi:hypothetical protein
MQEEIQRQLSEHVKSIVCQDCGKSLAFEVIVFPEEIAATRVVAVAKAQHCDKRYTVRARRETSAAANA